MSIPMHILPITADKEFCIWYYILESVNLHVLIFNELTACDRETAVMMISGAAAQTGPSPPLRISW
jgi:hypothetical protein